MVSLKTHGVYPEIMVIPVKDRFTFTARLIAQDGAVKFTQNGVAGSRKEGIEAGKALINEEAVNHLREGE